MKLEPGEVICSKCNGSGDSISHNLCSKCHGTGKLDWIENIVGKRPKYLSIKWPTSDELYGFDPTLLNDKYIKVLSDQLAKSIDEEILKTLNGVWTNEQ